MISELFNKHKKGLTNYAISKHTGISISTVDRIFKGESEPGIKHFFLICKLLEIPTSEITALANQYVKNK